MGTVLHEPSQLKTLLESLYETYNDRRFVDPDPLVFLYDYDDRRDREVAGMIASSLAFGNVKQILRSIGAVLRVMGPSPAEYVCCAKPSRLRRSFSGFRHRWIRGDELVSLLLGLRNVLRTYGSLESCFCSGLDEKQADPVPALSGLVDALLAAGDRPANRLLAVPVRKSACKRLNLFLRWMVRRDNVDPGVWKSVSASMLIVPLDTYMFRFGGAAGFTSRKQADLEAAREITARFGEIAPDDPVKYDFALTRLGIRRDGDRGELIERLGMEMRHAV